jgi:hypothetical protein
MKSEQVRGNGEDLRLHLDLSLDGGRGRGMTATIGMTALNDEQQARFEAEVEILLTQFVRQQVKAQEG